MNTNFSCGHRQAVVPVVFEPTARAQRIQSTRLAPADDDAPVHPEPTGSPARDTRGSALPPACEAVYSGFFSSQPQKTMDIWRTGNATVAIGSGARA